MSFPLCQSVALCEGWEAGIQSINTFLKCNFSLDPLLRGDDKHVPMQRQSLIGILTD
ncbi:hypothetical protein CANDROIZ_130001 [Candidatus Roizmanbacteria bacterium]|nr:hypothetical protein CANDROIZ_130001 [Candidatus Roizmanbacteria bacterium]